MHARRTRPSVIRTAALRVLAVVASAAIVVASVIAMRAHAEAPLSGPQPVVTIDLLNDDPLAKFAKLMPALKDERCVNCHGGTNPFTGANHFNSMEEFNPNEARRVRNEFGDHDFRNVSEADKVCRECHNDPLAGGAWVLPPKRMSFLNQKPVTICSMWQLSMTNSREKLLAHLRGDNLIKVAFKGSKGIVATPPDPLEPIQSMRLDKFLELADKWLQSGSGDIPCAGWEGTITQTERVNLTTNHATVIPGVSGTTTDTQDATRTVTITLGGTVDVRIAVQGTERSTSTLQIGSGGQSCTSIQRMSRVYGTENGETSGEAVTAKLVFSPGGKYAVTLKGPDERTVRVERTGGTLCSLGEVPEDTDTLKFDHHGWTLGFDGVLPNPDDRTILKSTQTKTVTEADAWLTHSGGAVTVLQTRDNGEMLPVPVVVTTTWDLRRRK